jgi:putative oxidoreductase
MSKKQKIVYRGAKGFISVFMLFSAYYSFSHAEALRHLGFPNYFRIELVTAKVIGAVLLLIPQMPGSIKEWIYSGFGIAMVSAMIAHICGGDPVSKGHIRSCRLYTICALREICPQIRAHCTEQASNLKSTF